jgi:hypothetical protein
LYRYIKALRVLRVAGNRIIALADFVAALAPLSMLQTLDARDNPATATAGSEQQEQEREREHSSSAGVHQYIAAVLRSLTTLDGGAVTDAFRTDAIVAQLDTAREDRGKIAGLLRESVERDGALRSANDALAKEQATSRGLAAELRAAKVGRYSCCMPVDP